MWGQWPLVETAPATCKLVQARWCRAPTLTKLSLDHKFGIMKMVRISGYVNIPTTDVLLPGMDL